MTPVFFSVVIALIALGLLWWLTTLLPLPAPIHQIIRVVFIIAAIYVFLGLFGVVSVPKIL